ncbi:hypothetical protein [Kurthia massiliensis]|uniref:hypothetical protein n=1 Tax=Kurthia massiliensis TaxID=1033739 RepID=UPI0002889751|nr:hypothetical protein [Kurthia massiliensis]
MSRMNEYHQPIGEAVNNWTKRKFPGDMYAGGTYTTITKLTADHIPALCKAFAQTEARHWTYLSEVYSTDEETLA